MGCGCSVRDPPHREGSFSSYVLPRTTALWYEPEMDSYAGDVPQKRCGSSLLRCSNNSEQKRVGTFFCAPVSSAENSTERCRPVRSVLANPSYEADRRASAPHPLADSIEGWSEGSKNKMQTLPLPSGPSAESVQLHSDESIVTARGVHPGYDYAQYFRDAASPRLHGPSSPTQPNALYSIPANALRMMEQGKHATFTLYDTAALQSVSADTTDAMPSRRLMPPRTDGHSSPRLPTPSAFAAPAVRSPTTPVAAASAFEIGSGTTLEDIAAKWASVPLRSTSETGTSAASSAGRLPNPDASYQLEKFVGMQRAPVGGPPRVPAADSSTSVVSAAAERSRYLVRPVGTTSTASGPRSGTSAGDSPPRPAVVPIQYKTLCVTALKPVAAGVTPADPLPSEKISLSAGTHSPSVTADTTSLFASRSPSAEKAECVEVRKPQIALREVSTESPAEACDSQTQAMPVASPPVTKTSTQTPARSLPISAPSNTGRFPRRAARMERSKAVVANKMAQQEL